MSTTARKARKREGIQFQHAVKEATPIVERAAFQYMQPKKAAEELAIRGFSKRSIVKVVAELIAARKDRREQRRLAGSR